MRSSALGLSLLVVACSVDPAPSTCVAGRSEACACSDGRSGSQTCMPDGTFGSCTCTGGGEDAGRAMDAASPSDAAATEDASSSRADAASADAASADTSVPDAALPTPSGHIVLIGGHLLQSFPDGRRMLVNAVALSEAVGPIRVLDYAEFTDTGGWDPRPILRPEIDAGLAAVGRSATYRELPTFTDLSAHLPDADVLLIYAQWSGGGAQMNTIAAVWRPTLVEFLARGGVIVVLDSTTNLSTPRGMGYRLVHGPGLLTLESHSSLPTGTIIEITTAADPVAAGVISHTTPNDVTCFPGAAGGTIVTRTSTGLCPTAVHAVRVSSP